MHQVVMELGVVSEYDPVYRTPCFSDTSPMHLQSSSAYSDTLCIGLCMLHNSAPPPASTPPHVLPPLVCLFVYLCHWCTCCLFCLFVSPSRLVLLIDGQWTSAKSDCMSEYNTVYHTLMHLHASLKLFRVL